MPGFDGTGPQGNGPFTGGGRGYCAISYPASGRPYGYAGLQGRPIRETRVTQGGWVGWNRRTPYPRRGAFGRPWGRGRGPGHGRGRRGR